MPTDGPHGWRTASASLDLASTESAAMYALTSFTTPAVTTRLRSSAGNICNTNDRLFAQHGGVSTLGAPTHGGLAAVHQICWYRKAATDVSGIMTYLEA